MFRGSGKFNLTMYCIQCWDKTLHLSFLYLCPKSEIMAQALSEQEMIRRNSLNELLRLGINPYPPDTFEVTAHAEEIKKKFAVDPSLFQDISISGRIMSRRIMGAASFVEIQDSSGRIQLYVKRDDLCPGEDKTLYNTVFKKLLDIGDIIGVKGFVFMTHMGEITLHFKSLITTLPSTLCRPDRESPDTRDLSEKGNSG
jgi:lysyl-tRNA synthetase class II